MKENTLSLVVTSKVSESLTLLDYYVTHAPAVPPSWWKPEIKVQPKKPSWLQDHFTKPEEREWLKRFNDEEDTWYEDDKSMSDAPFMARLELIPQEFKDAVAEHIERIHIANEKIAEWQKEYEVAVMVQWPFYYALQMIEFREKGMKMFKKDNDEKSK